MNQAFDASIPVLTEVLRDTAPADEAVPQAAPVPVHAVPAALDAALAAASPLPEESDADAWEALERRLSERVLQQLNARVDFVLEQRIKDSISEVLDHALHGLTMEIRHGLHDTIGKIVARAVQQEITHLQASSTQRK